MNICKSILKRIGLIVLVAVGIPVVFAVITSLIAIMIPIIVLGAIGACLFCSDETLKAYLDPDNELLMYD